MSNDLKNFHKAYVTLNEASLGANINDPVLDILFDNISTKERLKKLEEMKKSGKYPKGYSVFSAVASYHMLGAGDVYSTIEGYKQLKAMGFDVNEFFSDTKDTALMIEARRGNNAKIIKALLDLGADKSMKNRKGQTAYQIAYGFYKDHPESAKMLGLLE